MSHSFYIGNVGDASLSQTLEALPFDDLIVEPQNPNGGWPEIAHVYQDGVSVRAIETAMEGDRLQVRIMAYSSPDDFALAAAITDQVASQFGKEIEPEDNESMSVDRWREEYGLEWQREQAKTYLQMLVSMYTSDRHDGVLRMWGTRQEFLVGPRVMDPLLADPDNFSKNFFERVRRLNYLEREDVFGPSLLAAREEGSGKQAVFCVLGEDVPTALSSQAAFVVLNHAGLGSEREDDGQTTLTFDDFADIAGDSLTWLGDGVALTPAYQGDAWQTIIDAAKTKQTGFFDRPELLRDPSEDEGNGSASPAGDDAAPFGISNEHWELLAHSVIAVFLIIAGADGTVDKKEVQAFQKNLLAGVLGVGECEIIPVAFMKAAEGLEQRLSEISQMGGENIAGLVAASRQIVEAGAGAEKAAVFAKALYDMAESIAMASGGGFLGMGSKVGKEEKVVLNGLRQLLQLDT